MALLKGQETPGGGGGTPGGPSGSFQYNNVGTFDGLLGLTYNGSNILAYDSVFRIVDNTLTTRELAWNCGAISGGTTRTITMVDFSGVQVLSNSVLNQLRIPFGLSGGGGLLTDVSTFLFQQPATLTAGALSVGTTGIAATLNLGQDAATSGTPQLMQVVGASHTGLTASTETTDIEFRLQRTVQFAGGAKTLQRAFVISNPTYSASLATTTTDAATFEVSGAPIAGTNMTITRSWAARLLGNTALANTYVGDATGSTAPSAKLHLAAGTATAGTAPLQFTSGTSLTTAIAGTVEMTTDDLFFTITTGAARKRLLMANPVGGLTSGRVSFSTTNGRQTDSANFTYATNRLSPTYITLAAGAAGAGNAPLVFTTGTSLTTAIAGAMEYTTPRLFFTNGGNQRQEIPLIQSSRVTTQFDKTSDTTAANITGLTATIVGAGRIYRFEARLFTTSNVAGGVKTTIGGTATLTSIIYETEIIDAGLTTQGRATAAGTTTGVTAVTDSFIRITGHVVCSGTGTITVQFAQNASNVVASSVLVGSTFETTEMV